MLQNKFLVDSGILIEDNLTQGPPQTPLRNQSQEPHVARTSITTPAAAHTVSLPIAVKTVVQIIHPESAQLQRTLAIPDKPQPWTPVRSFLLKRELSFHPDKVFVRQLVDDLQHGCSIGYTGPQFAHLANNLTSAYQQPGVIDAILTRECEVGRILGPFQIPPLPNFRTSGLGVVPKHDGGWRIIYHLSAPAGYSINDYIDPALYSLSYCSIDDAYAIINKLGPGALLSKIDLKDAFRLIPVCTADWNLLGIYWNNYYIDTCLPFGLRSAPYLFNRLASALHWILEHNYGVDHLLHYLDDFFTAGPASSNTCEKNLHAMLSLCDTLNVPVKTSKVEGPTTSLTFLGIHLNTVTMEASITSERKQTLLMELFSLHSRAKCTKRELLSLIGKLSFSCKILPAGRIFLRRLIDLSTTVKKLHHHIRLTVDARSDMQWWLDFLPNWSGKSLILEDHWTPSTKMQLFTDASGTIGWGAYWSGKWLQGHWSEAQLDMDITWKELFAIVMAVHTWGSLWQKQKILFHCDNQAVVSIWESGSTRAKETMALVRLLYFCAARYNINVCIVYIAGTNNEIADCLSRFQQDRFRQLAPQANLIPDNTPAWPTQSFIEASCSAAILV